MRTAVDEVQRTDYTAITPLLSAGAGVMVFIRDLAVTTLIGVYDHERRAPQPLMMDLDIELGANRGGKSDDLADTVDYAEVVDDIRACLAGTKYYLLERVAELVAERIIARFGARRVVVQIAKVGVLQDVRMVGVRIERPCTRRASRKK